MAQIGQPYPGAPYPGTQYPGGTGYPGGRYPGAGGTGLPFPGRNKGRKAPTQVTDTVSGRVQRISTSELILEPEDKRLITVSIEKTTQYFKGADAARFGDLDVGDQVSVDAARDTNNNLHAVKVTLEKKAGEATAPVEAAEARSTPAVEAPIATTVAPKPAERDADDPGPPTLRRAGSASKAPPAPSPAIPPTINAAARASAAAGRASEPVSEARVEAPPTGRRTLSAPEARPGEQMPKADPIIEKARETAFTFTETLPNYQVKQFTARYQTGAAQGDKTQWQALDVVTADVLYEEGKESYKNLQINGKPSKDKIETTGSWSTGEFATVLQDMLSPYTDADFYNKRSATISNHPAWRYDYTVEQPNSHWKIIASAQTYMPAYRGSIWIDKENSRVLRIEMSSRNMPKEFPLDKVESATEYDYVVIGNQKFLLPTHSESLSCVSGSPMCSRNVIDFRNYRKFGSDTEIKFDPQ